MNNLLRCGIFAGTFFVFLLWQGGLQEVHGKTVKWDSQADWAKGSGSNVTTTKRPGSLEVVFDPNSVVETPFIYIPNSKLNSVTKMDTNTGKILWTFNLAALPYGKNPSRTTVDSKGNVWVGLRDGNYVVAISSKGKFLAAVNVGKGPRAVTIDKQGNIWAGGYYATSIVKISGQTYKPLLTVRNSQICTYGAATDADGNIWTMNRCKNHVIKISPAGKILRTVSTYGGYGIAADRIGHVWVASYEGRVAYRINARTYAVNSYSLGARGRGVGIDSKNRAWVACSTSSDGKYTIRRLVRIDQSNGKIVAYSNVGMHTIGVAIDSKGFVWANSYSEGRAYKLKVSDGSLVTSYPICDTTGQRPCANTGCTRCSSPKDSGPYTYSDMTGFSILTKPAQGTYRVSYDATCKASFSKLSWTATTANNTTVQVRARTASTKAGLASASWAPYVANGRSPGVKANRWIEVEFLLKTPDSRYTPVVENATLEFNHFPEVCDGVDNNCDGKVDENFTDLGAACNVGVGACSNSGKKVCNSQNNGTQCSVKPKPSSPEVCDGIDNNCNGKVDENFPDLGTACKVGVGACVASGKRVCATSKSKTTCSATPGKPKPEVCDGIDNNCDGKVDENWPNKGKACEVGIGSCKNQGTWICKPDRSGVACSVPPKSPKPEICDGADNDCNGKVDDSLVRSCNTKCGSGVQNCQMGKWSQCSANVPKQEVCNNQDDDCDGQVDNNLERVCSSLCGKGKETCVRGKWVFCSAKQPTQELCDGKDNDCDGKTDEDLPPKRCMGDCGAGTATCQAGKWSGCSGPSPKPETCDGKDNDCNGKVDDNVVQRCRSACGDGRQVCVLGKWSSCNAPRPGKEICDGKDNDCDGKLDNGNDLCPSSMVCKSGVCQQVCRNSECPKGFQCKNGLCLPTGQVDPCKSVTCQSGTACVSGKCVDRCYLTSCPKDQICEKGQCVEDNCYRKGCPNGQRCVDGNCESDPCSGVRCDKNQFCRKGQCIPSCADVRCKDDQKCEDGKCITKPNDPCKGVRCNSDERCNRSGKCESDPCSGVTCPKGRRCLEGVCVHDSCFNIRCPNGQVCLDNQCVADPKNNPGGEKPATREGNSGNEDEVTGSLVDGGNGGSQPKGNEQSKATDDDKLADKSGGRTNNLPDDGTTRYKPGDCACHYDGGPTTAFFWFALLFGVFALRRFRRNRPR